MTSLRKKIILSLFTLSSSEALQAIESPTIAQDNIPVVEIISPFTLSSEALQAIESPTIAQDNIPVVEIISPSSVIVSSELLKTAPKEVKSVNQSVSKGSENSAEIPAKKTFWQRHSKKIIVGGVVTTVLLAVGLVGHFKFNMFNVLKNKFFSSQKNRVVLT